MTITSFWQRSRTLTELFNYNPTYIEIWIRIENKESPARRARICTLESSTSIILYHGSILKVIQKFSHYQPPSYKSCWKHLDSKQLHSKLFRSLNTSYIPVNYTKASKTLPNVLVSQRDPRTPASTLRYIFTSCSSKQLLCFIWQITPHTSAQHNFLTPWQQNLSGKQYSR